MTQTAIELAWIDPATGKVAAVLLPTIEPGSQTLAGLTDVLLTGIALGEMLAWDGTHWINVPAPSGGGGGYTKPILGIPASDLDASSQADLLLAATAVQPAALAGLAGQVTKAAVIATGLAPADIGAAPASLMTALQNAVNATPWVTNVLYPSEQLLLATPAGASGPGLYQVPTGSTYQSAVFTTVGLNVLFPAPIPAPATVQLVTPVVAVYNATLGDRAGITLGVTTSFVIPPAGTFGTREIEVAAVAGVGVCNVTCSDGTSQIVGPVGTGLTLPLSNPGDTFLISSRGGVLFAK